MKSVLFLTLIAAFLASCAQADAPRQAARADLEDFGPAPALENEIWLNTVEPLHLSDLRGKVVLLDMWTFG